MGCIRRLDVCRWGQSLLQGLSGESGESGEFGLSGDAGLGAEYCGAGFGAGCCGAGFETWPLPLDGAGALGADADTGLCDAADHGLCADGTDRGEFGLLGEFGVFADCADCADCADFTEFTELIECTESSEARYDLPSVMPEPAAPPWANAVPCSFWRSVWFATATAVPATSPSVMVPAAVRAIHLCLFMRSSCC